MKCITVKELYRNTESYLDKEITVAGWLRSNRGSKAFGFLVMGDGSYFQTLQIVYHDNMENFKEISKLNVGALGSYKIWLAQYAAAPTYNGRYDMWQYSSKGKIGGISGYTDLNISYLGY